MPASAARGLSPDAPAAAPAKYLLRGAFVAILLGAAAPAVSACINAKTHHAEVCRQKQQPAQRFAHQPAKPKPDAKIAAAGKATSGGSGSAFGLRLFTPNLMP